jgi:hypothetical protein
MNKKVIISCFVILLFTSIRYSSGTTTITIEWRKTFGGTLRDIGSSLIQTTDGGFALVGETFSYGAGETDMWLVKTDANGEHKWDATFGGTEYDDGLSLVQTVDSGFVLVGTTESYGTGETDMWLVKTDANGEHEWNTTFGGTEYDDGLSLIQTTDGGFAKIGSTKSYGAGYADMWLIKTNDSEPTQVSATWTPVLSILSLTALLILRKRLKHR